MERQRPRARRFAGVLLAALISMTVLASPAQAAVDPLYERPPAPPEWLAQWLEDWQEAGALTPDLVAARPDYQWTAAIDEALAHAEEVGAGVERWRPLVELYFRPGDVNWALRVMRCESHGDPYAKNPRSSARGLFQHLKRYWSGRSRNAGFAGADIFDPEANVAVAAWLLYQGGGKSHWTCRG